jgi:Bacterial type II secretion system protein G.
MALEGTLRDFSLADIFQLIGLQRKTGVLTLRGKDDTVTVTFLDGKVVAADSLNRRLENRLGTVLIKTGRLAPDQLNRALEIQKETLQRLGFILTHYGIIPADALRDAIQLQIMQIVYRLFRWKDGEYHFSQETTIEYDRDNVTPISAESILMEGARMIDEWPIIEKRIRSYDMVFRKKKINQEIIVVSEDEADEVDFEESASKKRRMPLSEKIKITQDEKTIYDLVDGVRNVGDVVEASRISEFDTNKTLYELLNRDLIEEVRETAAAPVAEQPTEPAEISAKAPPVPLPMVLFLGLLALASVVTSFKNPLNWMGSPRKKSTTINESKKAISFQRLDMVARAVEAYNLANGSLPGQVEELTPNYISADLLRDPWGNSYKYIQRSGKYLLIGFTKEGRADTDLFLSHSIDAPVSGGTTTKTPTGGIELVP